MKLTPKLLQEIEHQLSEAGAALADLAELLGGIRLAVGAGVYVEMLDTDRLLAYAQHVESQFKGWLQSMLPIAREAASLAASEPQGDQQNDTDGEDVPL